MSMGERAVAARVLAGRVHGLRGQAVEIEGLSGLLAAGDRIELLTRDGQGRVAEIVGFASGRAQAMAFGPLGGIGPSSVVRFGLAGPARQAFGRGAQLRVHDGWIGRVIDPLGRALDGRGALPQGAARPVQCAPPEATARGRLGPRIDLGVRAMDAFTTCRQGQRLGLFAGSGVGKSTLLAMLARRADCDVVVVALVGERGREVREFLEDDLGADGQARAVTIVATSDAPPLMRREAALAAMTVAEHFRDQGRSVLLLMDSVTRFCLALREIGLAAGEPPATRGYPPSVFAELPRLLERAGPGHAPPPPPPPGQAQGQSQGHSQGQSQGQACGSITALFTVLVEGDDHNEPVADAARGILDGHVVLDRRIGEAGRYPAIDVLRSLSRSVPGCLGAEEAALARRARGVLALHAGMADMLRLGAYRAGTDPQVDEAVALQPRIDAMLRQDRHESGDVAGAFAALQAALAMPA